MGRFPSAKPLGYVLLVLPYYTALLVVSTVHLVRIIANSNMKKIRHGAQGMQEEESISVALRVRKITSFGAGMDGLASRELRRYMSNDKACNRRSNE
jgi:hypothetical protein